MTASSSDIIALAAAEDMTTPEADEMMQKILDIVAGPEHDRNRMSLGVAALAAAYAAAVRGTWGSVVSHGLNGEATTEPCPWCAGHKIAHLVQHRAEVIKAELEAETAQKH